MSRGARKKGSGKPSPPPESVDDGGGAAGAGLLVAAIAASALAVDSGVEAPFEAPKRLAVLLLTAAAAAAVFGTGGRGEPFLRIWRSAGRLARASLALAAAALTGAILSALASPRPAMSLDALRGVLLTALLLPLGASRIGARRGRLLLGAFLAVVSFNAIVSLLQGLRLWQPFSLQTIGSRDATGAFVGNVGYLATAMAIAAVAALAAALESGRPLVRVLCAAALPVFLADLVLNQNLTALTALAAGGTAFVFARFGKRAAAPAAAVVACVVLALFAFRPARARAGAVADALRKGDWDRVLTYRLGPWGAAVEMTRERPLLGFGPGTFAAEFVPHRLKAEIRARRRFVNPLVTSSYGEAHSEPLQAVAEGGVAGLAALAAAAALLIALAREARSGSPRSREAALLFALLVAGAVASITWFPLQRPVSAIPLLLAAGRGWRIVATGEADSR
jgi:O-antigen ligase